MKTPIHKSESELDKGSLLQLSMAVLSILVILGLWSLVNAIHIQ